MDPRLQTGRAAYARGAWREAFEALSACDEAGILDANDLEELARAAYMVGRDVDYVDALERAHHAHEEAGDVAAAALSTWWIGHHLLFRGRGSAARGWFARGQRLLDEGDIDCPASGYLRVPDILWHLSRGDPAEAADIGMQVADIAKRFDDQDLLAIGLMERGRALVALGQRDAGLGLVDEMLVAVTTGDLSPIVTGIVYCNLLLFLARIREVSRAREWVTSMTAWCDERPQMIAHNGPCRLHRAQLKTIEGRWDEALEDVASVTERFTAGVLNEGAQGDALYLRGEIHRLRGERAAAERLFEEANRLGRDPVPGLAMLRLEQGEVDQALAGLRRALSEAAGTDDRTALLPALVEMALELQDLELASDSARELDSIAQSGGGQVVQTLADDAAGAVALARGDAAGGLRRLRQAWYAWQGMDAHHLAARTRVRIGLACRALGDEDAARLALSSAAETFASIGARPDLEWVTKHRATDEDRPAHGLSDRELEVLGLVAVGHTNKEVAAELVIAEKTVERHLSNIYTKLDVPNRSAATTWAHEHGLL